MKHFAGTPTQAALVASAIATSLGYPRRGVVVRAGEHVTGDSRYDVGLVTQGQPAFETSEDGSVVVFSVNDETEARLPPGTRALLKPDSELPQKIRDKRDKDSQIDEKAAARVTRSTP